MAQEGNGSGWSGPHLTSITETTAFVIGGAEIAVPALSLYAMELTKEELLSLGPNLDWITYGVNVIHIVYTLLKIEHPEMVVTRDEFLKSCSLREMRELPVAMNRLLDISGFDAGAADADPNALAANQPPLGTGTSTPLLPNLLPEESVEETHT